MQNRDLVHLFLQMTEIGNWIENPEAVHRQLGIEEVGLRQSGIKKAVHRFVTKNHQSRARRVAHQTGLEKVGRQFVKEEKFHDRRFVVEEAVQQTDTIKVDRQFAVERVVHHFEAKEVDRQTGINEAGHRCEINSHRFAVEKVVRPFDVKEAHRLKETHLERSDEILKIVLKVGRKIDVMTTENAAIRVQ